MDSWAAVARYTSLVGRLQVLGSEPDPGAAGGLGRAEYERVCALLERYFNIVITDSGTGFVHPAMAGTLARADSLVIVGAPTVDGAGRASQTLDWLWSNGYGSLAGEAVAVLSASRSSAEVNRDRIRQHFAARCRAVVDIPPDPHLAIGGRVELARLHAGHPGGGVRARRPAGRRVHCLSPPRSSFVPPCLPRTARRALGVPGCAVRAVVR